MPVTILFGMMLFFLLTRVFAPIGNKTPGKVVKVVYMSIAERSLMQRVNLYSIGAVLLLMTVAGQLPTTTEVIVVVVAMMIMALPARVLISSEGVGINKVVYRPWSDFTGFSVESRRIVLIGREGTRPFNLPLLASHQKEVIPIFRRHLSEVKARRHAAARG